MASISEYGKKKPEAVRCELIDIEIVCSVCGEYSETANYFKSESKIIYECSLGHKTTIEGIKI